MGKGTPNTDQVHYRIRSDSNSADGGTPTWETTEDQNPSTSPLDWNVDTNFRVRYVVNNTGDANARTGGNAWEIFYSINSGTYTQVATSGTAVLYADASSSASGDTISTSNFALTAGTGTAETGLYLEADDNGIDLAGGDYTEFEYGLTLDSGSLSADDTVDLRIYVGGSALDTYTITPRLVAKVPGITGTMAATESGSDTSAISGTVPIAGTMAATESGSDTAAISGTVPVAGTLAATESGSDTFAATGTVPIAGTMAAAESGSDTAAITGTVDVDGSMAATESGSDTSTITGTVPIAGTMAATESGSDTFAGTGTVGAITGSMAATESGSDTFAASGTVDVTGSLAATESGSDTFASTGTVDVSGTLAATESGSDTLAATGTVDVTGTLAATETGSDIFAGMGTVEPNEITGYLEAYEMGQDVFQAYESYSSPGLGFYAADGSWRVTIVDGSTYTGLYAPDESMYIVHSTAAPDDVEGGIHPCGARIFTTAPEFTLVDRITENGSLHIQVYPYTSSGAQRVTVVSPSSLPGPTPTQVLAPPKFTNTSSFISPTLGSNKLLIPPLITNTNSFVSPTVAGGPPANSYVAPAVHFEGTTRIFRTSFFTPYDEQWFTFSVWFKIDPSSTGNMALWSADPDINGSAYARFTMPNHYLYIYYKDPTSPKKVPALDATVQTNFFDGQWHHLLCAVTSDEAVLNRNKRIIYIDDVLQSPVLGNQGHGDFAIAMSARPFYIGEDNENNFFVGDMADFWFNTETNFTGTGSDLDVTFRRKFIDGGGKPVDPVNFPPGDILFSGDHTTFANNQGTGGTFTVISGVLTDATTSPSD